jgi:hypothetical protein
MTRLLAAIQQLEAEGALRGSATRASTVPLVPMSPTISSRSIAIDDVSVDSSKTARRAPSDLFLDPRSAEAYRGIARQLARSLASTGFRSIAVVTCDADGDAGEIAGLLSAALADVQRLPVLCVTADRGSAVSRMERLREASVGEVLDGASWDDAIHPTTVPLVNAACLHRDAKSSWERQALRALWKSAPERFGYTIVSVGQVQRSESLALAASCDTTCVAVGFGRIDERAGKRIASRLRQAGATVAGCILI